MLGRLRAAPLEATGDAVSKLVHEDITEKVIGAAMEVHRLLGPGLLESAYAACLSRELELQGLSVHCQVPVSLDYKGLNIECAYRFDMVVEGKVVVELKSVEVIHPVHEAQLLTYLKLSGLHVGLLLNFNVPVLKDGIIRKIH